MKLSSIILRTLLGVATATLGYVVTHKYPSQIVLFGIPQLFPTIIAFALGAFSVLILPIIALQISRWFHGLIGKIVMENLTRFWEEQLTRFRERELFTLSEEAEESDSECEEELGGIVLDTSVIIDGRVLDIVEAGFLPQRFIIPRFIVEELQDVADSEDDIRRKKGRRGLKVLEKLRKKKGELFEVWSGDIKGKDIDRKLISLAKRREALLLTIDFNLNKAARVTGVEVLNINELANALRIPFVPGETLTIKLIQPGKEEGQGVGYLEDGTMIVVEGGEEKIGDQVKAEVTRSLQTEAGQMIFATLSE
ncbi:MAG: TRAM domain-containing protein [Patescibacteria group bacterium]|nr:TRAM domain-containing protein [Patescibacteria group bacterium]